MAFSKLKKTITIKKKVAFMFCHVAPIDYLCGKLMLKC